MASTSYATISSSELSHLVLEYLHSEGFTDTTEKVSETGRPADRTCALAGKSFQISFCFEAELD